ncbi:guanitoxin biosynthesis L-enduracididine beta-hydroxylase GntD [Nonomuraea monospora]|uniref:guanitoxin biosynthesis L-enduracididine beta-hydroxylase GntD n=1 Tax=Nonomuraea monospora TaxID=568818 RepID=UPI0031D40995
MITYELTPEDIARVEAVVASLTAQDEPRLTTESLLSAALAAHELPPGLRRALTDFRLREPSGALMVRGFRIDDVALGPTPRHWRDLAPAAVSREDAYLLVVSSLMGEVFGWATQQDGRLLHNVLPIAEHADEQLGSGSRELLWWHTEDAFHAHRADYVSLLCLRNPDKVATTYVNVSEVRVPAADKRLLFEEAFTIRPDNSHLPQHNASAPPDDRTGLAFEAMAGMHEEPPPLAVLFGDPDDPYARLDPYFMEPPADPRHAAALDRLRAAIEAAVREVILQPGDCLILDNYRSVHGRVPFRARFDGTDRWLKRVCITRNLRSSRAQRRGAENRVVYG